ncbi:sugar kinase [Flavobacterium sp. J27]|uniref:sugar kinase n=1 Tax=Flavobacterium sp. J27 TaxID=2060419 RepID=UPI0010321864|nr:sugar kinase [Flavobacterium sp. J27]
MRKVITFGEILMRLSTENKLRFSQTNTFNLSFGGSEFNVAVSLANFGIETEMVTILSNNDLGKSALKELKKHSIETKHITFSDDRLGIYFLEEGSSLRSSNVIYDRSNSAMTNIKTNEINWEEIFKNVSIFHWSGITPALSKSTADVCLEALQFAQKAGVKISCDLNYRAKLWKYGREPFEIMPKLLSYCHVILGDIDTALFMLGQEKINPNYQEIDGLNKQYDTIFKLCPTLEYMSTTLRYSINHDYQQIGGVLYDGNQVYVTPLKDVTPVLDRIGTGDAFMAGLLFGLLNESFIKQQIIDFATISCILKHTIKGDTNWISLEEVQNALNGNLSGKVNR